MKRQPIAGKNGASRRILLLGATGFIGSHVRDVLQERGHTNVLTPTRADADLRDSVEVRRLLSETRPDVVVHLAGLVGGIGANMERPAEFFHDNLMIDTILLHESWKAGVGKFLGCIGGCSYPADAPSPISEDTLLTGLPHPAHASYSFAKAMMVVQAQAYRRQYGFNAVVLVPGNVYGPRDNFDSVSSHVIPALIRKVVEARRDGLDEIVVWGSGRAQRDFVYIRDAAEGIVHAMETYDGADPINISRGESISIARLVDLIREVARFEGRVVYDASRPDGHLVKIFDTARMRRILQFECRTSLREGLEKTVEWYARNHAPSTRVNRRGRMAENAPGIAAG